MFLDHMAHFVRERIPERMVHAKGAGAFGYFEVTHDISKFCKAAVFREVRLLQLYLNNLSSRLASRLPLLSGSQL